MPKTSAQVIKDSRDYTLFPWTVQSTADPIHITRGEGVWFWDGDGNRWLDFCSQLVNVNIGHQHPRVVAAIKRQADELCVAGPGFATEPRAELGKRLAGVTGLAKSLFTLGGTEANESAMKIARSYTGRQKILSRYRSYHGDTMGSMSASGDYRRWPAEPGVPGHVRVFDPYCYRCPFGKAVDSCDRECVSHIEEVIQMEGPHTIAAMLVEGITGTNGLLVPPDDYYPKLRALLDKHGILLIDDEVMCGCGRTGRWLALQHYGIEPDIVTFSKGLTSSYVPLGAVVVSSNIADYLEDATLWTGLTCSGHPLACAAALANLAVYEEEQVFENVQRQGAHLGERLEVMRSAHACVGDARCKGLFGMLELVRNKATKEPLSPYGAGSLEMDRLAAALRSRRLYTYVRFNTFFVAPPLIISREEIDHGLDIIEAALAETDERLAGQA